MRVCTLFPFKRQRAVDCGHQARQPARRMPLFIRNLTLGLLSVALFACGGDGFECGDKTTEVDGSCVPNEMICATGTTFNTSTRRCEADTPTQTTCGAGTTLSDGECVPSEESPECGPNTMLMGNQCVPDGSMICTGNTLFDMETGTCVVDPNAICDGNAVLVEATETCVDSDSTLEAMADSRELMEPNDPAFNEMGMPQMVDVSSDPTSVWGCIRPTDFDDDGVVDADLDYFAVEITDPGTVLDVTIDGVGGLSAGVVFFSIADDMVAAGWERNVVSLSNDGASGKVFFPEAGTYYLATYDSRFLFSGAPAGNPTPEQSCYFLQLSIGDDLTPVDITAGTPQTGIFGEPTLYRMSGVAGDLLFGNLEELNADGEAADNGTIVGAFVQTLGGQFRGNAETDETGVALNLLSEIGMDDDILFVVDHRLNVSYDEIGYRFTVNAGNRQDLPEDGVITIDHQLDDELGLEDFAFLQFTGTSGDVLHVEMEETTAGDGFLAFIVRPDGTGVALHAVGFFGPLPITSFDEYVQLDQDGLHYVAIFNMDADESVTTYDVTLRHINITPAVSTRGMPSMLDLSADDSAFIAADLQAADWLEFALGNMVDVTNAQFSFYARGEFGRLDSDLPALDGALTDGAFERIPLGDSANFLIRVQDADGTDGTETFDLTISDLPFTDLGTLTMDTTRSGETVAMDDVTRYVVRAEPGAELTTTATPMGGLDAIIDIRDPQGGTSETINDVGADAAESFSRNTSGDPLIFQVSGAGGTGGTYDLDFVIALPPYIIEADSGVTFTSICPDDRGDGVVQMLIGGFDPSDDGELETEIDINAFGFLFFGNPVSTLDVLTNGWVSLQTYDASGSFNDTFLRAAGTEMLDAIAPAAVDIRNLRICTLIDAETLTVQWDGDTFGASEIVQMQMILRNANHRIDFVYGPDQSATLTPGGGWDPGLFIGLQRGSDSLQLPAGVPAVPGQSISLTPR